MTWEEAMATCSPAEQAAIELIVDRAGSMDADWQVFVAAARLLTEERYTLSIKPRQVTNPAIKAMQRGDVVAFSTHKGNTLVSQCQAKYGGSFRQQVITGVGRNGDTGSLLLVECVEPVTK